MATRPILLYFIEPVNWTGLSTLFFLLSWKGIISEEESILFFILCKKFVMSFIPATYPTLLIASSHIIQPSLAQLLLLLVYIWNTNGPMVWEISSSHGSRFFFVCSEICMLLMGQIQNHTVTTDSPHCQTSSIEVKLLYCIALICRTLCYCSLLFSTHPFYVCFLQRGWRIKGGLAY